MPPIDSASFILLVYILVSAILVPLGLPLYFRLVPPNRFYGFRTVRTLAEPEVWYAVNRVTGGWMILTGAITAAVATWVGRAGYSVPVAASANLTTFLLGISLMLAHSLRTLWRVK